MSTQLEDITHIQFRQILKGGIEILQEYMREEDILGDFLSEDLYVETIEKLYVALKYNATLINDNPTIH